MKLWFVLPAYNEEKNLGPLLESIADLSASVPCGVFAVDDGSTDGTAAVLKRCADRLPVAVVLHPKNMGLGAALRTGLKIAVGSASNEDCVVTMDADNSHPVDLIPEMMKKISAGADVVIASRYAEGGKEVGLARSRSFLSAVYGRMLRFLFPIPGVREYSCSYRMMRAPFLKKVSGQTGGQFFGSDDFVCAVEFLLKMADCGGKFDEVPLVLRYDLKQGKSKMNVPKTIFRSLLLISRLKLRRR